MECQCHSERHTREASAGTHPLPQSQGLDLHKCGSSTSPQRAFRAAAGTRLKTASHFLLSVTTGLTFSEAGGTQATAFRDLGRDDPGQAKGAPHFQGRQLNSMTLLLSLKVFRDEGRKQELCVSLLDYSCGRVEENRERRIHFQIEG